MQALAQPSSPPSDFYLSLAPDRALDMGDWNSAGWPGGTLEYSRINSQAEGYLVIYSNRVGSSLPRPMCLTLPKPIIGAPITANGTQLFVEDCWDFKKDNQRWVIQWDGSIRPTAIDSLKCIDAPAAGTGGRPVLWDCNGSGSRALGTALEWPARR